MPVKVSLEHLHNTISADCWLGPSLEDMDALAVLYRQSLKLTEEENSVLDRAKEQLRLLIDGQKAKENAASSRKNTYT